MIEIDGLLFQFKIQFLKSEILDYHQIHLTVKYLEFDS